MQPLIKILQITLMHQCTDALPYAFISICADITTTSTSTASRTQGVTTEAVTVTTSRVGSTTTHDGWSVARGSDCAVDLSHVAHIGEYNWFHFMQRFWR